MKKATMVVAAVVGLAACASGPQPTLRADMPPEQTMYVSTGDGTSIEARVRPTSNPAVHIIYVSPDKAWEVLPIVFDQLGLPGQVLDENARTFGFERKRMRREVAGTRLEELVDCGMGIIAPNAATYLVTLSVVTRIRPEGGATAVEMQITGMARDPSVSTTPTNCASRGKLEQIVAQRIARLASM